MLHSMFEEPVAACFALLVDCIDKACSNKSEKQMEVLYLIGFEKLSNCFLQYNSKFSNSVFALHNIFRENSRMKKKMVLKQPIVKEWLKKLTIHQNVILFILSDATFEHVAMVMSHAYGNDWESLFHFVITEAKKNNVFN